jgi:hypothetical protein
MTSEHTGAGAQSTGARPITDARSITEARDESLVTVRLLGLPLAVQARAQEHSDELIRELTLVGEQMRQQGNHAGLPARLVTLIEQLTAQYSAFTGEQEQQVAQATAAGRPTIDLDYRVPASTAEAVRALGTILDEADEYCRAGEHLLTLPTPPDLVVYRRWFLDQFERQIGGEEPVSYARYVQSDGASRTAATTPR